MKCVICHGNDIQIQDVQEVLSIGNDMVFVPVRVLVCQTCGERYYDRRVMQLLEEAEKNLKEKKVALREVGKILEYA
jgi:YgiT-type zinc finger domain-containing protein